MTRLANSPLARSRDSGTARRETPRTGLAASFEALARLVGDSYGLAILGPFGTRNNPAHRHADGQVW